MIKNWTINLYLLTAMVGVVDAGYLTINHFIGEGTGCFLVHGCDVVLKSQYSVVFGVPVALGGLLYYLTILIALLVFNSNRNNQLIKNISKFTVVGLVATLWFLYLQVFVLGAFCSYCLVSAVTSIVLFGFGMYVLKRLDLFNHQD